MKIIKLDEATEKSNSEKCKITDYSFGDNQLNLVVTTITGRYPESGYCLNEISKELIYVLEGEGKIVFENTNIKITKGDSILISPNEKYYWDCKYCVATITCTPPWNLKQYKHIEDKSI